MLRGYSRDDLDSMFQMDVACFEEPFRFSKANMRGFAEAPGAQVLVATQAAELAGFSIVHVERTLGELTGYLVTLDVALAFRRRGLAGRLLLQAEDQAQRAGCVAMLLHVFTGNAGAVGLYQKFGYRRVGTAKDFYASGIHALIYRKPLA